MKYIISKKQYNLIVEQSAVGLPPSLATVDPKWTHETAMVLSIAAAFIPVVGPFLSSGIQLLDAAKYLEEGDKKMAGLMAMFAFLPGVITLVGKIPGIKTLGANGMKMLAQKISSNQLKNLTKVEQDVLQGLSKNKELVTTELNNVVKSKAAEVASKAANNNIKQIMKKLAQTGLSFSLSIGGYAAAGEAYSSIFDAVQKREEEESLKELEKQLTNLGYK